MEAWSKLSAGNKITLGVLVSGLIASAAVTQYQVQSQAAAIASLGVTQERVVTEIRKEAEGRVQRFDAIANSYESRLRAVEIAQASQTSDLRNIQIGINEIKDQIRRIAGDSR